MKEIPGGSLFHKDGKREYSEFSLICLVFGSLPIIESHHALQG